MTVVASSPSTWVLEAQKFYNIMGWEPSPPSYIGLVDPFNIPRNFDRQSYIHSGPHPGKEVNFTRIPSLVSADRYPFECGVINSNVNWEKLEYLSNIAQVKCCHFVQILTPRKLFSAYSGMLRGSHKKFYGSLGPAPQRTKDRDFLGYRVMFVDIDHGKWDIEEVLERAEDLGVYQNLQVVVETSPNKYHLYFKLAEPVWSYPLMERCSSTRKHEQISGFLGRATKEVLAIQDHFWNNLLNLWMQNDRQRVQQDYEQFLAFQKRVLQGFGADVRAAEPLQVAQVPGLFNPKSGFVSRILYSNAQAAAFSRADFIKGADSRVPKVDGGTKSTPSSAPLARLPQDRDLTDKVQDTLWQAARSAFVQGIRTPQAEKFFQDTLVEYFKHKTSPTLSRSNWIPKLSAQFRRQIAYLERQPNAASAPMAPESDPRIPAMIRKVRRLANSRSFPLPKTAKADLFLSLVIRRALSAAQISNSPSRPVYHFFFSGGTFRQLGISHWDAYVGILEKAGVIRRYGSHSFGGFQGRPNTAKKWVLSLDHNLNSIPEFVDHKSVPQAFWNTYLVACPATCQVPPSSLPQNTGLPQQLPQHADPTRVHYVGPLPPRIPGMGSPSTKNTETAPQEGKIQWLAIGAPQIPPPLVYSAIFTLPETPSTGPPRPPPIPPWRPPWLSGKLSHKSCPTAFFNAC